MNPTLPATRVRGLVQRFGAHTVLDRLDLDIAPGEFVSLIGRSGTGKSTLLRLLAGLDPVLDGSVRVPPSRAVVFQEPRLLPWKPVWKNVALGLPGSAQARARQALHEVGLSHRAEAWPLTLSGGEAQRAGIARALVRDPQLLLLDEPFGALDALTRRRMQNLVAELWARHRCAVLLVTHDVEEALLLADRVLLMAEGRIAEAWHVTLPRPRRAADPQLMALRSGLIRALGAEHDTADGFAFAPSSKPLPVVEHA
jgi:sulfonate transport system ATP-binding protein